MGLSFAIHLKVTGASCPFSETGALFHHNLAKSWGSRWNHQLQMMSHAKKAELIEGVVYMPSPVSAEDHGEPRFDFITWLGVYRVHTPNPATFKVKRFPDSGLTPTRSFLATCGASWKFCKRASIAMNIASLSSVVARIRSGMPDAVQSLSR